MTETATATVWETALPLPLVNRGKVRDIYAVGDDRLLIVTTDRLSAFDVVLPTPIPDKGKVLNQISLFWFERFQALVPHHLIETDPVRYGLPEAVAREHGAALAGRSVLVKRAQPLPIECVVRGYLAGSGWKDYQKTGAVCGYRLPPGLQQCQQLPTPIFTPATKATVGHDENIDFEAAAKLVGAGVAAQVRDLSIRLYQEGAAYACTKGILIADTKFEFGRLGDQLLLIDEVLTPDSSRFWPADGYAPGHDQPSFDKQIVRNWLERSGWDKRPPAPALPPEVAAQTAQAYRDAFTRLTGSPLAR
ncbi:MAG: phosphoribosylaminoimidazolesuccinocarboxamide synthase [Candidatus Omnitrophica bacterium]|nr:phosphoribosylaminoimidazolesuccinocarboxamide synthase [Candidatus Omnitrophota bacterium]